MRLDSVACQVIGVFATRGSVGGGGDDDNSILMPLTNVQRRFTGNDNINYLVVAYDPKWPAFFDVVRQRIARALGELAVVIEHIGSTAVPGLAAKPY